MMNAPLPNLSDTGVTASQIWAALTLQPHPEGGWYRETYRHEPATPAERGAATAILFLLAAGETSALHRVDAEEIWAWHAGAALDLTIGETVIRLGPDLANGESLQAVVPAHIWQAACSQGAWTLVSCIVAPAFSFAGFELA
jgi:predicted cupin superfamily sugar epimerase